MCFCQRLPEGIVCAILAEHPEAWEEEEAAAWADLGCANMVRCFINHNVRPSRKLCWIIGFINQLMKLGGCVTL